MLSSLVELATAVAAAGALLGLAYLAFRSPAATCALVLATWVATTALRDALDLSVTVDATRFTALDVEAAVLGCVGICRTLDRGVRSLAHGLVLTLLVLLAWHLGRGALDSGLAIAVNDGRGWFYFAALLAYAATIPPDSHRRIWQVVTVAGMALAVVGLSYLAAEGLHPASYQILRDGTWTTARPVVSTGALLILQAAVLAPVLAWPSARVAPYTTVVAGSAVVLLSHRTVWAAGLVVALVGFASWSERRLSDSRSLVFGVTGIFILLLPLAIATFSRSGPLVASLEETTASSSTLTWRTSSWKQLLASHDAPAQIVTGDPAGTPWIREIEGRLAFASPHNGFVDAYLRFGLPGVVAFSVLGLVLWRRRSIIGSASGLTRQAVTLLLLTLLVFNMGYSLDAAQGLVMGLLVATIAVPRSTAAHAAGWSGMAPQTGWSAR